MKTFGCARFVWNQEVARFNEWKKDHPQSKSPTIKELKQEFEWLSEVPYVCLEQKLRDWREFKSQYFNKKRKKLLGRPKFKKRGKNDSVRFSFGNGGNIRIKDGFIRIVKLGELKTIFDRPLPEDANIRSCTVSRDPSGKFYISVLVKCNIELKKSTGKTVGIDLGLKDLFTFSDGEKINNPKWFHENQVKLKKAQQHLSRKVKGSNRYKKQKIKVARIHEKIRFQRTDLLHKISTQLVDSYDVICIEDLNVVGMLKNHRLAKAIQNACWSSFVTMLDYKCEWYGKTLVKIDQFFPSSKTCSTCGYKLEELDLSVREWTCPDCGEVHDRDINAAKNIEREGINILTGVPSKKVNSAEYVDHSRGEFGSLRYSEQSSLKRLDGEILLY